MKTIADTFSLFRLLPAACLVAGMLAAPGTGYASQMEASLSSENQAIPPALLEEIATRVKQKADFGVQLAPVIAPLFKEEQSHHRDNISDRLIFELWKLASSPKLQKDWIDKLTDPALSNEARNTALREFKRFMRNINEFANEISHLSAKRENIWKQFRNRHIPSPKDAEIQANDHADHISLAALLEKDKQMEAAFTDAILLRNLLGNTDLHTRDIAPYALLLLKIKSNPEDLQLAVRLIDNENIPINQIRTLLRKLKTEPAAAREEIKALTEKKTIEERYAFAALEEGPESFVLLPLASIMPSAVNTVKGAGTIPLTGSEKNAKNVLSVKRLEELFPKNFTIQSGNAAPPFLNAGERLYAVLPSHSSTPAFAGTPLAALSDVSPGIVEYTKESVQEAFLAGFLEKLELWGYLVAAECGPEELAAHLGSLGIMLSAREKSLYGEYADFVWNNPDSHLPYSAHAKGELPEDSPGEALRLVQINNSAIFFTLAPLAAPKGLERLMGPIRGVWTKQHNEYTASPWVEMRYTPKKSKTKTFTLGKSPLLRLEADALKALTTRQENALIRAWTSYIISNSTETLNNEQCAAIQADMEKKFAEIRAKGFISPMHISDALYFMEEAGDDAAQREKLRVVLDDTSLSSAKRVAAMRGIIEKGN